MSQHATQWVHKQRGLSQGQRLLLLHLASIVPDGDPIVSVWPRKLAADLEVSMTTLSRRTTELVEMGKLSKTEHDDGCQVLYLPVPG